MRIQYASDLHTEYGARGLTAEDVVGDVLVLAGDIAGSPRGLARFLRALGEAGKPIVVVLGNHEFYGHDFVRAVDEYRDALAGLPRVHLLEGDSVTLGGVRFLGATLWTDLARGAHARACARSMTDFYVVRDGRRLLSTCAVTERHNETVAWLRQALTEPFRGQTVVITHHAPSFRSEPFRYAGSPLGGGFCVDLEDLLRDLGPDLWVHGHIHSPVSYLVGRTRVVSNPFGYLSGGARRLPLQLPLIALKTLGLIPVVLWRLPAVWLSSVQHESGHRGPLS